MAYTILPPSRHSRELALEIFHVIKEYRSLHPDLTVGEIRRAIQIIEMEAGGNQTRNLLIGLCLLILLLMSIVFYLIVSLE